jgi:hypothetical protein
MNQALYAHINNKRKMKKKKNILKYMYFHLQIEYKKENRSDFNERKCYSLSRYVQLNFIKKKVYNRSNGPS